MNALSGVSENSAVIGSAVQPSMGAGLMAAQSSAELSDITASSDGAISDNEGFFHEVVFFLCSRIF